MSTAKALDQFYTNPIIAEKFVERVNALYDFRNFDYIVEPSMGEGFIYDYLPEDKRIGLDIEKNHPDCQEGDFFDWNPEKSGIESNPLLPDENDRILMIGNPPFGRASTLAIQFFSHAAQFSDVIAFIIPRVWLKYSVQNRLPSDFGLYWQAILPDKAFLFRGKKHEVKCVAQCWSRFDPKPESNELGYEDWRDIPL